MVDEAAAAEIEAVAPDVGWSEDDDDDEENYSDHNVPIGKQFWTFFST